MFAIISLLALFVFQVATEAKNNSFGFDFDNFFQSEDEQEKWLLQSLNAKDWFRFAEWKINLSTNSSNSTIENCRLRSDVVDQVDNAVSQSVSLYCFGPALKSREPNLPNDYYITCANANIYLWSYMSGNNCSFSHQARYIAWDYACNVLSLFWETHRIAETRGKFGRFELPAFVYSITPFLILIIGLSVLNYVIIGRVLKKADEGPILYHRFEIGCDFALAVLNLLPDLNFGVIASWLNYSFFGICLHPTGILSWLNTNNMTRNVINDLGMMALAMLAHDKYEAVADPIIYMTKEKRPGRNLGLAFILVIVTNFICLIGDVLFNQGVLNLFNYALFTCFSDAIRAFYLIVCLYITVVSSKRIVHQLRQMDNIVNSTNQVRNDMLNRTAKLTLQTCMLNGLSLIVFGLADIINLLIALLKLVQWKSAVNIFQFIYDAYFFIPQYGVVICSSNIAFVVHCYYSKLYREAVGETYATIKARCKFIKWFDGFLPSPNAVHPGANLNEKNVNSRICLNDC